MRLIYGLGWLANNGYFFLASRITVLKLFDLMASFYFTKLLRASESFCVYELYLSIFAVLENKAEKLLNVYLVVVVQPPSNSF